MSLIEGHSHSHSHSHSEPRLQGAPNFRDLGGALSVDGRRLSRGRVFRSEVLSRISDADIDTLRRLSIGTVCDLRHGVERTRQVNRWPTESLPRIIGGEPVDGMEAVQSGGVQSRIADPDFDLAEARSLLIAGYRLMPRLLAPALRAAVDYLLTPGSAPLLVHCTSGKDRSGFVCAMLLTALDIPRQAVLDDYLLSRERYPVDQVRQALHRALGDTLPPGRMDALLEIASVSADYLDAAFVQLESDHGSAAAYLHEAVGLDAERRRRLQNALLI